VTENSRTFVGTVQRPDDGPGHAVALPFDPVDVFGRARVPVLVSVPGSEPFRTTIATYATRAWIGLRKAQLAEFGVSVGDEITMTVIVDDAPRTVDVPPELAEALNASPDAGAVFAALSYSHRREYADWVREAKQPATRTRRAARAIERIRRAE
jgi:hypothetical protein